MEKMWREKKRRDEKWKKYCYLNGQIQDNVFSCECGKSYKTFPGLYLHFQRTHSQKISTKPLPHECTVVKNGSQITHTYIIKTVEEEKEKFQTISSVKDCLSSLFQQFSLLQDAKEDSAQTKEDELPIMSYLIQLQIFILAKLTSTDPEQVVSSIPNYFNSFILSRRDNVFEPEENEKRICQILFRLWEYLASTKKTNLLVEYSETQTSILC